MRYIVLIKYSKPVLGQNKNFHLFHTMEEANKVADNLKKMYPKSLIYVRELTEEVEL